MLEVSDNGKGSDVSEHTRDRFGHMQRESRQSGRTDHGHQARGDYGQYARAPDT